MGLNPDTDTLYPKPSELIILDTKVPKDAKKLLDALSEKVLEKSSAASSKRPWYDPHHYSEKWEEYCAWCYKVDPVKCKPTLEGFQTWMSKQTPYWREHTKVDLADLKWELNGKRYTSAQASRMMRDEPAIFEKFKLIAIQ